jgi:predicted DNA-binding antitoxin AbrB/MazE fold protein|tara:strand:+ start:53 stop:451 length:399 start_codon:yes stop_codon:yes gene_type:complete
MDLKDLTPNLDDVIVTIKHPTTGDVLKNDDGTDMTITVLAPHSKEYKKAQHEQISKRLKKAQKSKSQDVDYSDIEEATLEVLAKVTKAWDITFGGEKPELTVAIAKSIYDEVFWIKNQIEEEVSDSLDFMKV